MSDWSCPACEGIGSLHTFDEDCERWSPPCAHGTFFCPTCDNNGWAA